MAKSLALHFETSQLSGQTPQEFEVQFNPPIYLTPGKDYIVSLNNMSMWYSWSTISAAQGNNILRYVIGGITKIITFEDGCYSLDSINAYIHDIMQANGDLWNDGAEDRALIEFEPKFESGKILANLNNGAHMDLTVGTFYDIIGFGNIIYLVSTLSPNEANIENGVSSLNVHCSLIGNSFFNGRETDILYHILINTVPGYQINVIPQNPIWLRITQNTIYSMKFRITDQQNRLLDLRGEDVSIAIQIKEDN